MMRTIRSTSDSLLALRPSAAWRRRNTAPMHPKRLDLAALGASSTGIRLSSSHGVTARTRFVRGDSGTILTVTAMPSPFADGCADRRVNRRRQSGVVSADHMLVGRGRGASSGRRAVRDCERPSSAGTGGGTSVDGRAPNGDEARDDSYDGLGSICAVSQARQLADALSTRVDRRAAWADSSQEAERGSQASNERKLRELGASTLTFVERERRSTARCGIDRGH